MWMRLRPVRLLVLTALLTLAGCSWADDSHPLGKDARTVLESVEAPTGWELESPVIDGFSAYSDVRVKVTEARIELVVPHGYGITDDRLFGPDEFELVGVVRGPAPTQDTDCLLGTYVHAIDGSKGRLLALCLDR